MSHTKSYTTQQIASINNFLNAERSMWQFFFVSSPLSAKALEYIGVLCREFH